MNLETVEKEVRSGSQEQCLTCGESNFYSEGGFFYCSLCNTQSQSAQVYVDEGFGNHDGAQGYERNQRTNVAILRERKRGRKGKVKTSFEPISSWEECNIILKIMADRLVEIGFPEIVKSKILNLYVDFMIKRKVIFISKLNPNVKSSITYGEPKQNLYALYGIQRNPCRQRGRPLKNRDNPKPKSNEGVEDSTKFMSLARKKATITLRKRKAMEKEYLNRGTDGDAAFEELINKMRKKNDGSKKPVTKNPNRFVLSKGTKKLRLSGLLFKKVRSVNMKSRILKRNLVRSNLDKATVLNRATKFERFHYKTCLILVFVALRQLGFPVVMADVLRLHYVGILDITTREISNYGRKYKEYENMSAPAVPTSKRYPLNGFAESIYEFVTYLEMGNFRYPQFKEIVPKYIDDFVLPREFECLVSLINHTIPTDVFFSTLQKERGVGGFNDKCYRMIPEIFVLAQIVVVLKMLFGLDDVTERYQSRFAKIVNQVMTKKFGKIEEWGELFVIEDWFPYLLRRKELVKTELCSPMLHTPNQPLSEAKLSELFENTCKVYDIDDPNIFNDEISLQLERKEKAEATKSLTKVLENITNDRASSRIPKLKQYVPLPLPNESIVQQYIERYPTVADPSYKPESLKTDFVRKRIDFVWNPEQYRRLLKINGYTLKVIEGDAINDFPPELECVDLDKEKILLVFQPYKSYDDFVGLYKKDCSSSLKLLIEICEDIAYDFHGEELTLQHERQFMQTLINIVGNLYVKMIKAEQIPVLVRWDDVSTDSDS